MASPTPRHRKRVHLVCNAHLDPVWQWTWEDGLTEALSTFRVAADFCDRHPGFVFNHNESLLYGWVLKHDPALFGRIRQLVRRGQWHIAGGAYLQPDVNTPGGESHIRQFLYGLEFFRKHFRRRPTTAYNFDPFGHPEGFPQILAGCGMDSYVFCRPDFGTHDLPRGAFHWTDRSGAQVLARRSDDHYLSRPGGHHDLDVKLPSFLEHYGAEPVTMILWGIGNHGGGPSRVEFNQLRRFIAAHPEYRFIHSTPEAFFVDLRQQGPILSRVQGEIEHSFPGCYTSMSRVKRAHRAAEHLIVATERLAALAWWYGDAPYPAQPLHDCWRDLLFCQFHDILPGSGVPRAERDALAVLGGVQDRLRRLRFDTVSHLARGERPARPGAVPIFIVNPHGHRVRQPVELDYTVGPMAANDRAIRLRAGGRRVAFQRISSDHNLGGQEVVRLVVPLDLAPFEFRRLDADLVPGEPMLPQRPVPRRGAWRLESRRGTVFIGARSGLIDALVPAGMSQSLVRCGAMRPVLFADLDHSWTCGDPGQLEQPRVWSQAPPWKKPAAQFRLATPAEAAAISPLATDKWKPGGRSAAQPVRVIEHGPQRTTLESLFVCGPSYLNRHYVFCHVTGRLEVRDRVVFNHKDHMLKLTFPLAFTPEQSRGESLYSVVRRPPTRHYEDRHQQRWVAAVDHGGRYLAVVNDGSFAHCLTHDTLAVNVLRSPAYASFLIQPGDPYNDLRFAPRQDQGEHDVRYLIDFGPRLDEPRLTRLADGLNAEPYAYVYYPGGTPGRAQLVASPTAPLRVSAPNVRIVAVKRAQRGKALIVRLQELAGRATPCRIWLGRHSVATRLNRWGLSTLRLTRRGRTLTAVPVNLVEGL